MRRSALIVALLLTAASVAAAGSAERREQSTELRELLEAAEAASVADDLVEAGRSYEAALALVERFGPRTLHAARAADGLADVHRRAGRNEAAIPLYRRSIPLWESLLGPTQPRLAVSLHNLGVVYLALNRPDAARPVLEQALAIWTVAYGADSEQARNTGRALDRTTR